jgi:hypothetical protein
MKGLGPTSRHLLDLGREAGEPDAAILARNRASLLRRVGGVVATGTAVVATPTSAAAASLTTAAKSPATAVASVAPLAAKLAVAAVVAMGVGTFGLIDRAPRAPAPANRVVTSVTRKPTDRGGKVEAVATSEPRPTAPLPIVAPPALVRERAPLVHAAPRAAQAFPLSSAAPSSPRAESSASPAPSSILAADVSRIREAQVALLAGDPHAAIAAADRVSTSGPLDDERDAVRLLAACALGAPEAGAQARAFIASHPQSPLAIRVHTQCLGER